MTTQESKDAGFLAYLQDIRDYDKQQNFSIYRLISLQDLQSSDKFVALSDNTYIEVDRISTIAEVRKVGSHSNREITPWVVGVEWLTGDGPRERHFTDGDYFTEMLKKHDHIETVRREILYNIRVLGEDHKYSKEGTKHYGLSGIEGVGKYIKDYSTLFTGGITGNLAVTYLGSYRLSWKVISKNYKDQTVIVEFKIYNESTIVSGIRPPVVGYSSFYKNIVSPQIIRLFETGPMSKTTQTFTWKETLKVY